MIRQFFHARQSNSVLEYVEQFDGLVHQFLAHDSTIQAPMIVKRFIDGLKIEIRAPVLMQRPVDLDTACSLAILQEVVLGDFFQKGFQEA